MTRKNFEHGLSPKILELATKNRPPSSVLTFEQIQVLAEHAKYRIMGHDISHFVLFSINGGDEDVAEGVGIQTGLRVNWMPSIAREGLAFRPILETLIPGEQVNPSETMLNNLERHLSKIGIEFSRTIPWPKGERVGSVPTTLRSKPDNSLKYMFKSEMKREYYRLYLELKEVFDDEDTLPPA